MQPLRVVLDTSVLVSSLLFHTGSTAWLREAWQTPALTPLASKETASELIRVLFYPKFGLTADEREDLLADYLPWCEAVTVPPDTNVPDCRDPFDRPFLALAAHARADALITGDKDMLVLAGDFGTPIMTPATFRDRFADRMAASRKTDT